MDPKIEKKCDDVAKAAFERCLMTPITNAGCLHYMGSARALCYEESKAVNQ